MRLTLGCIGAVVMVVAGSGSTQALAAQENELVLTAKKVVVFKDGHFLVVKNALGTTDDQGEMVTSDVPDSAVLGTVWAHPKNGTLLSMKAGWAVVERTQEKLISASETRHILEANLGKQATVVLVDGTMHGVIHEVLAIPDPRTVEGPEDMAFLNLSGVEPDSFMDGEDVVAIVATTSSSLFVLRTEDGDALLRIVDIKSLVVDEMTTVVVRNVTTTKRTKRLSFRFARANERREMEVRYFRPGLRWVPTYRLDLKGKGSKKTADLSLQAEFINEAEDLVEVPTDIVVGVPNFRFKDIPSPLTLEKTMKDVGSFPLGSQIMSNRFDNAIGTQEQLAWQSGSGGSVELPDDLSTGGSNDLFVYSLPSLTLKKGERAAVPILSTRVDYQDLYTWNVSLGKDDPDELKSSSPLPLRKNDVWHQIELVNSTEIPWTTGSVLLTDGDQPLAQELLTYTAAGDTLRVPLTVAVNIPASLSEEEIGREPAAEQWQGWKYTRISKKARLRVFNGTEDAIEMEIVLELGGRVDAAPAQGQITKHSWDEDVWGGGRGAEAVNSISRVRWKRTLKAKEVFEPVVEYYFLVRQ